MKDKQSLFKLYSRGIVVHDKKRNEDVINVTPIEDLTEIEGEFREWGTDYDIELPDINGVAKRAKVKSIAYITAVWLALHQPHRKTSPDVISGEVVNIYRYADSETYYWDIARKDTRKTEHVLWSFCNNSDKKTKEGDGDSYDITISTKDKYIEIKTNDNDGEHTKYIVRIDTKNGTINIIDGINNSLSLDSKSSTWTIVSNNEVNVITNVVNVNASTVNVNAPDINMNAGSITANAPNIILNGSVLVTKGIGIGSSGFIDGGASISGDVAITGSVNSTGSITSDSPMNAPAFVTTS